MCPLCHRQGKYLSQWKTTCQMTTNLSNQWNSEYGYTLKMNETQREYQNTMLNVNIGTETPGKHC